MTTHQADSPCSKCGSWYRDGEKCNKCGKEILDKRVVDQEKYSKTGRAPIGQLWNKKAHKYI